MIKQTPWAFPFLLRFSTNLQIEVPLEEGIEIYTALPAPSLGELEPDRIVDFLNVSFSDLFTRDLLQCALFAQSQSKNEESGAQSRDRMKSAQPHRSALSI